MKEYGFKGYAADRNTVGLLIIRQDNEGKVALLALGVLNPVCIASDILLTTLKDAIPLLEEPNTLAS